MSNNEQNPQAPLIYDPAAPFSAAGQQPVAPDIPYIPQAGGLQYKQPPPSTSNIVENTPEFQQQIRKAWDASVQGGDDTLEAGFGVGRGGDMSQLIVNREPKGTTDHVTMSLAQDSLGAVHTHPSTRVQGPSQGDIDAAKAAHKTLWTMTGQGLYSTDPGGQTTPVFAGTNWIPPAVKAPIATKDQPTAEDIAKMGAKGGYIKTDSGTWHIADGKATQVWKDPNFKPVEVSQFPKNVSQADIDQARKSGKNVYVNLADGTYLVKPNGDVSVFQYKTDAEMKKDQK